VSRSDAVLHVRGESRFVDDLPEPQGLLHAAVCPSPVAHGRLRALHVEEAFARPGVVAVFTARDIPGENQIGTVIRDEPLLADGTVHFVGQPMALIVAESAAAARAARAAVRAEIEELPAILDPREACARGELIAPARTFALGDVDAAWQECDVIVAGRADSGGQEHVYLETQSALAIPAEHGGLRVFSATQAPTATQRVTAWVLGLPMHAVEVDTPRLGGAFGGKEDQATAWAALAALAAYRLHRPVKLVLRRQEDMRFTGKRHPYSSDFKLGLRRDGTFLAYEVRFHQNAGATADLSTAILERTLFHTTNAYFIPNVRATAFSCRTNLPPNTAFRGFGAPQAMFVMECAIAKAAEKLGVEPRVLQEKNLLRDGDVFPYGQEVRHGKARASWAEAEKAYDFDAWAARVREFNAVHAREKKGLAFMPICFGISFTTTFLNQASALVHVYTDGSVGVSTAAVEMGQGVNEKLRHVAARVFSLPLERVHVESTNTTRAANTSPTAASSGADLNGNALLLACGQVRERLLAVAAERLGIASGELRLADGAVRCGDADAGLTWEALVADAYLRRVSLSAQAHYATPGIHFDRGKEKGEPFAYHVWGTAGVEVTLDVVRGTYVIDAVRLVHDAGQSLEPRVDLGQIEGGLVQGLGWMTVEEVLHSPEGRLLTDTLTTYKVPDLYFAPRVIETRLLEDPANPRGPFNSKAIGEPPFLYGVGVYFALLEAMRAARPGLVCELVSPLTPERVLMTLAGHRAPRPIGS